MRFHKRVSHYINANAVMLRSLLLENQNHMFGEESTHLEAWCWVADKNSAKLLIWFPPHVALVTLWLFQELRGGGLNKFLEV